MNSNSNKNHSSASSSSSDVKILINSNVTTTTDGESCNNVNVNGSSGSSSNGGSGKCGICSIPSKLKCSNCNQIYYCSVKHQKDDWKKHKRNCHPFIIKSNERFGRYVIASRNIKSGEIVLKESALVCGPSQITGPVCIGCMKGLNETDHLECEKCGWPICQRECQNCPEHKAECELTINRGDKIKIKNFISPHPMYQCMTTLRCLLLKETNYKKWERLMQLESHEADRKGSDQWKSDLEGIAKFIPRFFKCTKWSEDDIMKVAGILQINGHEVPLSEPAYVAIFDLASLFEHSCYPNLTKCFTNKGDVVLWSPHFIKKDTNLSICYSDTLWGTKFRQQHLKQTKLFKCECIRCLDVTEFETYYSALKCNKNKCDGFVLPLNLDMWDENWKCRKCYEYLDKIYVLDIIDRAGKDLTAMDKKSIDNCLRYINHYTQWLPKQNHFICEAKVSLAQLIGSGGPEILQSIDDEQLNMKMLLCKEMIALYEKLAPVEVRILGLLCFEMHAALAERGRRSAAADDEDSCTCALEESLEYVEKTIKYLQHEPSILTEGQIYGQAKINRDSLKIVLGLPV